MEQQGSHIILDLHSCNTEKLDDADYIKDVLEKAAVEAKANIIQTIMHRYQPQGVTGVCLVAESHLSIHTWPEHGFAAVDIFMCGKEGFPEKARAYIRTALEGKEGYVIALPRGENSNFNKQ